MHQLVGFEVQSGFAEVGYFAWIYIWMRQKIVQDNRLEFEPPVLSPLTIYVHASLIPADK